MTPFDDWESYRHGGLEQERLAGLPPTRPVVRSRTIRGFMWFALAVMPARERWQSPPHAIVQPHDGPVLAPAQILASLPSAS